MCGRDGECAAIFKTYVEQKQQSWENYTAQDVALFLSQPNAVNRNYLKKTYNNAILNFLWFDQLLKSECRAPVFVNEYTNCNTISQILSKACKSFFQAETLCSSQIICYTTNHNNQINAIIMKLPLKEPLFAKYMYVSEDNTVHVFMPVVSGTRIGLDNTCKAVYSLQEFFDKGSNSNQKASLKKELLAYKEALESDISLLGADTLLAQQKQERLRQINAYLEVLNHLEQHQELNCLNQGFPSYPRPLESMMQDRKQSNLYSMVLRPSIEDGFLRSEAANPVFSVAHKSNARGIDDTESPLQQALIRAYTPLTYEAKDLKSQVVRQTVAQLKPPQIPVDFEHLRELLGNTLNALMHVSADLTQTQQGTSLEQQNINEYFDYNSQIATPEMYIDALLGYCAPNLFDTAPESPFNSLIGAESWSIATQFLLGITNIHAVTQGKISTETNFGQILDAKPNLSESLAQTLAEAQKHQDCIEEIALSWMNAHAEELTLNTPFTPEDIKTIKETFATLYTEIKDSPHFDEFFVLDPKKKGDFVVHQGAICTSFAKFASSPLFDVPKKLTQPLAKACTQANTLGTEPPHINPLVQGEIEINTATMDNAALQALYEGINNYKDPKLKKELRAQLQQERPDFKPQIEARKFLQHVAYGEQNEAEDLLKNNPELAQELLTANTTPFTDYSGRTFNCTAYEYAYWAKDTHMCRMLEKYMEADTKQELLKRVQALEELTGPELFQKPRGLTYTQKGKEHRSAHFELTPLKQALKTYIEAYGNGLKRTTAETTLDALWIKVGLLQREVPAHIAQEYCHPDRSFGEVSQKHSLLDAANPNNLKRQLKIFNWVTDASGSWFTPNSYSTDVGLGFSFAILRERGWRGAWRAGCWGQLCGMDLAAIEAIDKVRTEDLKRSLANLAAPPVLSLHHGS